FHDATHLTGAGEARNRTRRTVERTAPFVILVHTLVVLWYHLAGHSPKVVTEHRRSARWYTTKTHPSYQDMLIKLRRVLIAAHYRADLAGDPTPRTNPCDPPGLGRRHSLTAKLKVTRFDTNSNACSNGGVRWDEQRPDREPPALLGLSGLVRSVRSPEFAGVVFHEVRAKTVLNKVPGDSPMPFRWTVNPYRGCSHGCTYCFARNTHTYLDLDAGHDFNSQVVVKVNAAEVLAARLNSPRWTREHVAMGTNTDPYQRAEGRYQLMPGIIRALADSGTPFSILTKGTTLARDLPLLAQAATRVPVGLGVSIALVDRHLQRSLEPGTPSPQARLELVRKIRDAGLPCGVFVAPVLPALTDSVEHLDSLLGEIAAAGATGVTVLALHLRPGAKQWFAQWLRREHPDLVEGYRALYGTGSYVDKRYRAWLSARVKPLLRKHGLASGQGTARGVPGADQEATWPAGALPTDPAVPAQRVDQEQLTLL
ncbi:Rv2578c family radical SAM protein, partial [Kutzneria viridogrisea]